MEKMKHTNRQKENTSTETHGKDIVGSVMVLGAQLDKTFPTNDCSM